jgi:hypothetical protein
MPMLKIKLSCGCTIIWHYAQRVGWTTLTNEAQAKIRSDAVTAHKCPEKKTAKAPPTSPEPQRP